MIIALFLFISLCDYFPLLFKVCIFPVYMPLIFYLTHVWLSMSPVYMLLIFYLTHVRLSMSENPV